MTQHTYNTQSHGRAVTVLMGWDRPLAGFFLVIGLRDSTSDEYLYSNLEDPDLVEWMGLPQSLDHFDAKLAEFGIELPSNMRAEILCDARFNVGNRYVSYGPGGEVLPA